MFKLDPDGRDKWDFGGSVPFGYSSFGNSPGSGEFGADPSALSQATREQWEIVPGHQEWYEPKIPTSAATLSIFIETVVISQEIRSGALVGLRRPELLAENTGGIRNRSTTDATAIGLPESRTGYRTAPADELGTVNGIPIFIPDADTPVEDRGFVIGTILIGDDITYDVVDIDGRIFASPSLPEVIIVVASRDDPTSPQPPAAQRVVEPRTIETQAVTVVSLASGTAHIRLPGTDKAYFTPNGIRKVAANTALDFLDPFHYRGLIDTFTGSEVLRFHIGDDDDDQSAIVGAVAVTAAAIIAGRFGAPPSAIPPAAEAVAGAEGTLGAQLESALPGAPGSGLRTPAQIKSEAFGKTLTGSQKERAEQVLEQIQNGTYEPPADLTREHLLDYKGLINEGLASNRPIDKSGVQEARLRIIDELLKRSFGE
jgi:hypothetical protein